jgi:putative spermidine/putrescine transport system ATP-binding protein
MSNGRLEQIAAPQDLYDRPRTRFVAEFVGLTNRLDAHVDGGTATLLGGRVPVLEGSVARGRGLALVRPEALSVELDDTGNATVANRSFLGALSRVTCDLDTGDTVVVQSSSSDAAHLGPGHRVRVTPSPSPVLVVAGE